MSGKCSICLSSFREPVSIPCGKFDITGYDFRVEQYILGHVYCTKCLADHVNTSGNEEATSSSCPTCRTSFKTGEYDLVKLIYILISVLVAQQLRPMFVSSRAFLRVL